MLDVRAFVCILPWATHQGKGTDAFPGDSRVEGLGERAGTSLSIFFFFHLFKRVSPSVQPSDSSALGCGV